MLAGYESKGFRVYTVEDVLRDLVALENAFWSGGTALYVSEKYDVTKETARLEEWLQTHDIIIPSAAFGMPRVGMIIGETRQLLKEKQPSSWGYDQIW